MANTFWDTVKESKEGIILGAIAGLIAGWLLFPNDVNLAGIANSYGIVDVFKPLASGAIEWARTKAVFMCIIIGAVIGGIADALLPEGWVKKKRRW